jgi:hypothetical protein
MIAVLSCVAFTAISSSASALTVSPAGSITGTAAGVTSLSVNGIVLTCTASTIIGSINSAGAGTATSVTYSGCRNSVLGSFTVTALLPWSITTTLSSGTLNVQFSNARAEIRSSFGCTFLVSGTADITIPGVTLPYTARSLTVSRSALPVTTASGCLGIVNVGNVSSFNGTYNLSPNLTVSG